MAGGNCSLFLAPIQMSKTNYLQAVISDLQRTAPGYRCAARSTGPKIRDNVCAPPAKKFPRNRRARTLEVAMVRLPVLASLFIALSSNATSAPLTNFIDVDGVGLAVCGAGLRGAHRPGSWAFSDPPRSSSRPGGGREARYRFIAYTQRYFGTEPWPDDGKNFEYLIDTENIAKFITSLNAGPVHLVTRSRGGKCVFLAAALKNPALVARLTLHEPALLSVLPRGSPEMEGTREGVGKSSPRRQSRPTRPVTPSRPPGVFMEVMYQLGPDGFDRSRIDGEDCYSTTREPPRWYSEVRPRQPSRAMR